jgi:hypothetical protein
MEEINLGLSDLEPISLSFNDDFSGPPTSPSVSFGTGIELLMNDKKKSSSSSVNIDLGELDRIEDELNELTDKASASTPSSETKTLSGFASNLFGFGNTKSNSSSNERSDSNLGSATAESIGGKSSTWDGYSKVHDIPMDKSGGSARMTDREKRRKKRAMIKKLEEWYEKGLIKNITHFNNDSAYEEVEDEYETALEDKRKKDSIKLQGWWFMTFVNSVEYANAAFNPFDLNLDGWGEQVSEDIDSYEEIFSELHEKYKGGKMAPELSLLLRLGFSAAVVNFTNKALSSATPGFNDVIRQSPELMKAFTNATVNSMSQQSPGFAFANNLMQEQSSRPRGPPPPAPVETKSMPAPQRPSMQFTSNRPDINAGRGAMFREEGVELNNQFVDLNREESRPPQRPEMRGPQNTDIDNILAGLKTRTVNIHDSAPTQEDDSMISISSLKDAQNTTMPKRTRRKQRSDKNTISLDI